MASRPALLAVLLVVLAAATAAAVSSIGKRGATLSYPAGGGSRSRTAFLSSPPPPTGSSKDASQPSKQQHHQQSPPVAAAKPLPLSRRGRSRGSSAAGRRHALPPFDTPLDPATIEAMVQQAGAPVSQQQLGGGMGEVTPEQLWVGFIAGVFPFVWAGYEFWKRIDTQQRCGVCQGTGLVYESRSGRTLEVPRKCYACGGFLPWMGWRRFWLSNLDVGNGGILQRPAPDYEALSAEAKEKRRREQQQGEGQGAQED